MSARGEPTNHRNIPRIWEVDWAIPTEEGGTPWEAYEWALETADLLKIGEMTIVASTYEAFRNLDRAIPDDQPSRLRVQPHCYELEGLTVYGVSRRGSWSLRGVVIAAWPDDQAMAEIESQRPAAVAAVAQWPDDIGGWRAVHGPGRIGQTRADQEAEFDNALVNGLDARAASAIDAVAGWVNEAHGTLDTDEREAVAGALVALRRAGIAVGAGDLRAHLMRKGWNGALIGKTIELAERVANGQTPRHRPYQV